MQLCVVITTIWNGVTDCQKPWKSLETCRRYPQWTRTVVIEVIRFSGPLLYLIRPESEMGMHKGSSYCAFKVYKLRRTVSSKDISGDVFNISGVSHNGTISRRDVRVHDPSSSLLSKVIQSFSGFTSSSQTFKNRVVMLLAQWHQYIVSLVTDY